MTSENRRRGVALDHSTLYPEEANPQAELWRSVERMLDRRVVARE